MVSVMTGMVARIMIVVMAVMITMMVVMMTMMEDMMMTSRVHPAATACPMASIATPLMFCPEDVVRPVSLWMRPTPFTLVHVGMLVIFVVFSRRK